jgi:hypothetical protein
MTDEDWVDGGDNVDVGVAATAVGVPGTPAARKAVGGVASAVVVVGDARPEDDDDAVDEVVDCRMCSEG